LVTVELRFAISLKVQEFVKAVVAYQKKLNNLTTVQKPVKLNKEMENKRKIIVRSFSHAKNLYNAGRGTTSPRDSELEIGAEFLEVLQSTYYMHTFCFPLLFVNHVCLCKECESYQFLLCVLIDDKFCSRTRP